MAAMNQFQRAVCLTYGGGDYAWIAADFPLQWREHVTLENTGDGLFSFLMRELADDGEPMTAEMALQRIDSAMRDLEGAHTEVEKLGC